MPPERSAELFGAIEQVLSSLDVVLVQMAGRVPAGVDWVGAEGLAERVALARDRVALAGSQLAVLRRRLQGEQLVSGPLPAAVGPAGGVLKLRAEQVQPRDRLIWDLRVGHEWPERPVVTGVRELGPMLVLEFAGGTPGGSAFLGDEWTIGAGDLVLVDRPAPVPAEPVEVLAAAAAEAAEQAAETVEPAEEPDPAPEPDSPAQSTVDTPVPGQLAGLLAPQQAEPTGPVVADPERGQLWLPSSPRVWAGRFLRQEVAR